MTLRRAPSRPPDAGHPIRPVSRARMPLLRGLVGLVALGVGLAHLLGIVDAPSALELPVTSLAALTAPGLVLVLAAARWRQRTRGDRGAGRPRVDTAPRQRPVRGPGAPGRRSTR